MLKDNISRMKLGISYEEKTWKTERERCNKCRDRNCRRNEFNNRMEVNMTRQNEVGVKCVENMSAIGHNWECIRLESM